MQKYNASMSFKFHTPGMGPAVIYDYNGQTGLVYSADFLRNPIKYMPDRVNEYINNRKWIIVDDAAVGEFPVAGQFAKYKNTKVFVVGKTKNGEKWVIDEPSVGVSAVQPFWLEKLTAEDENAFEIMVDLGIEFYQAKTLIKKGYVKQ